MNTKKQPLLILLVGSNGAGKTTFYQLYLKHLQLPFINADQLAAERWPNGPADAEQSYEAARMASALRLEHIEQRKSFVSETVFSHPFQTGVATQSQGRWFSNTGHLRPPRQSGAGDRPGETTGSTWGPSRSREKNHSAVPASQASSTLAGPSRMRFTCMTTRAQAKRAQTTSTSAK